MHSVGKAPGPHRRSTHLLLAAGLALAPRLAAAGDLWDGGGADNNWTTAANWSPDGAPTNNGTRSLTFSGGNRLTPNVNTPYAVNSIAFFATAGSFTIGGSTLTVGAGGIANDDTEAQGISAPIALAADQTWSASSGSLTFSSVSLGTNELTLGGAQLINIGGAVTSADGTARVIVNGGTKRLTGGSANTMTGAYVVNSGTLELDKSGTDNAIRGSLVVGDGVGSSDTVRLLRSNQIANASPVSINAGARLDFDGFSDAIGFLSFVGGSLTTGTLGSGTVTLAGGGLSATSTAAGPADLAGGIDLNGGVSVWDVADGPNAIDLHTVAVLSNGGLTKTGPGTLEISGVAANAHAGVTTVNAGVVRMVKSGGGQNRTIRGDLVIGDGVGGAGADVVYVGGEQIEGAAGTTVRIESSGLLQLDFNPESIADLDLVGGRVSIVGGSTTRLIVNGSIDALASAQSAQVSTLEFGSAFNVNPAAVAVADGAAATDLEFTSAVSGKAFTKSGAGVLRLSGSAANSIAGFTVAEGQVTLGKTSGVAAAASFVVAQGTGRIAYVSSHQLPDDAEVTVSGAGTFDLASRFDDVAVVEFFNGGTVSMQSTGVLGVSGSVVVTGNAAPGSITGGTLAGRGAVLTISGPISGAEPDLTITSVLAGQTIKKSGLGAIRLAGNTSNAFGALNFDAGRIHLAKTGGAAAIPAANVTVGGAGSTASLVLEADEQIADLAAVELRASGILALSGRTETLANLVINGGTVQSGNLVIPAGGVLTQNSGGNGAATRVVGTYHFNGGNGPTSLVVEGALNVNASLFTAVENRGGAVTVAPGQTLTSSGGPVTNAGAIHLDRSNIAGSFVNFGTVSGTGTLSSFTFGGITNHGAIHPTGLLTFAAGDAGGVENYGNIELQLQTQALVTGTGLQNFGSINLSGGVLQGSSNITNGPGGVIAGRGVVAQTTGTFANAGGVIRPVDGTLSIPQAFSSTGLIDLRDGNLAGEGAITNQGRITGRGSISKAVINSATGRIEPAGHLTLAGNLANAGTIAVPAGSVLFLPAGSSSSGVISLTGGTYDNNNLPLNSTGQISGHGTLATGGLTNNGSMTLTGGFTTVNGPLTNAAAKQIEIAYHGAIFTGAVVNNGTIKLTDTNVSFAGGYSGNGALISDPSASNFTQLSVGPDGYMVGGVGDKFNVSGNFASASDSALWNTAGSDLRFYGTGNHALTHTGSADVRFGKLTIDSGNTLTADTTRFAADVTANPTTITQEEGAAHYGDLSGPGSLVVDAGGDLQASRIRQNALTINAGGEATLTRSPDVELLSTLNTLTLTDTSRLSLSEDLLLKQTLLPIDHYELYRPHLRAGRIFAGEDPTPTTDAVVALVENRMIRQLTWKGETIATAGDFHQLLFVYTYEGDNDLDGRVDENDYRNVVANMGRTNATYLEGDLNYDGTVNKLDYDLVTANLGSGSGGPLFGEELPAVFGPATVPEPAALSALALVAVVARRRRTR